METSDKPPPHAHHHRTNPHDCCETRDTYWMPPHIASCHGDFQFSSLGGQVLRVHNAIRDGTNVAPYGITMRLRSKTCFDLVHAACRLPHHRTASPSSSTSLYPTGRAALHYCASHSATTDPFSLAHRDDVFASRWGVGRTKRGGGGGEADEELEWGQPLTYGAWDEPSFSSTIPPPASSKGRFGAIGGYCTAAVQSSVDVELPGERPRDGDDNDDDQAHGEHDIVTAASGSGVFRLHFLLLAISEGGNSEAEKDIVADDETKPGVGFPWTSDGPAPRLLLNVYVDEFLTSPSVGSPDDNEDDDSAESTFSRPSCPRRTLAASAVVDVATSGTEAHRADADDVVALTMGIASVTPLEAAAGPAAVTEGSATSSSSFVKLDLVITLVTASGRLQQYGVTTSICLCGPFGGDDDRRVEPMSGRGRLHSSCTTQVTHEPLLDDEHSLRQLLRGDVFDGAAAAAPHGACDSQSSSLQLMTSCTGQSFLSTNAISFTSEERSADGRGGGCLVIGSLASLRAAMAAGRPTRTPKALAGSDSSVVALTHLSHGSDEQEKKHEDSSLDVATYFARCGDVAAVLTLVNTTHAEWGRPRKVVHSVQHLSFGEPHITSTAATGTVYESSRLNPCTSGGIPPNPVPVCMGWLKRQKLPLDGRALPATRHEAEEEEVAWLVCIPDWVTTVDSVLQRAYRDLRYPTSLTGFPTKTIAGRRRTPNSVKKIHTSLGDGAWKALCALPSVTVDGHVRKVVRFCDACSTLAAADDQVPPPPPPVTPAQRREYVRHFDEKKREAHRYRVDELRAATAAPRNDPPDNVAHSLVLLSFGGNVPPPHVDPSWKARPRVPAEDGHATHRLPDGVGHPRLLSIGLPTQEDFFEWFRWSLPKMGGDVYGEYAPLETLWPDVQTSAQHAGMFVAFMCDPNDMSWEILPKKDEPPIDMSLSSRSAKKSDEGTSSSSRNTVPPATGGDASVGTGGDAVPPPAEGLPSFEPEEGKEKVEPLAAPRYRAVGEGRLALVVSAVIILPKSAFFERPLVEDHFREVHRCKALRMPPSGASFGDHSNGDDDYWCVRTRPVGTISAAVLEVEIEEEEEAHRCGGDPSERRTSSAAPFPDGERNDGVPPLSGGRCARRAFYCHDWVPSCYYDDEGEGGATRR